MAGIQIPKEFATAMNTTMNGLIVVINNNDAHSGLIKQIAPPWQKETPCTDEFAKHLDGIEVPDHLEQAHGLLVVLAYTQYLLTNMEHRKVSLAKSFDLFELITFIGSNTYKLLGVMSGFKKALNRITDNLQKLTDWSIDVDSIDIALFEQQLDALKIYQKLVAFIVNHKATNQADDVVIQVLALDSTANASDPIIPHIAKRIKESIHQIMNQRQAKEAIDQIEHLPLFSYPGSNKETLHQQQLKEMAVQIEGINAKFRVAMRGTFDDTKKTETEIEALSEQLKKINVKKMEIEKQTSIPMNLAMMAIVAAPDFSKTLEEGEIEGALSALSKHAHNSDNQQWLSINFNSSNHQLMAALKTIDHLVAYKVSKTNMFYYQNQDKEILIAIDAPDEGTHSMINFNSVLMSKNTTIQVYLSPSLIRERIQLLEKAAVVEAEVEGQAPSVETAEVPSTAQSNVAKVVEAEALEDEVFYDAAEELPTQAAVEVEAEAVAPEVEAVAPETKSGFWDRLYIKITTALRNIVKSLKDIFGIETEALAAEAEEVFHDAAEELPTEAAETAEALAAEAEEVFHDAAEELPTQAAVEDEGLGGESQIEIPSKKLTTEEVSSLTDSAVGSEGSDSDSEKQSENPSCFIFSDSNNDQPSDQPSDQPKAEEQKEKGTVETAAWGSWLYNSGAGILETGAYYADQAANSLGLGFGSGASSE